MPRFIEVPEGESVRLVNLSHVREAVYNASNQRLSLHVLGDGNEHLLMVEGPAAEALYAQLHELTKNN